MSEPTSILGRELYAILPAVYRDRDSGDLAAFLDACGELFDLARATLDQRLADCFPANPPGELQPQDWLLPYFADLLDAKLLSPLAGGRRLEVASAIAWRQRKGTVRAIEQIAEAVGQLEVEVQEGWRRLAVTPRIGFPILPASAFGFATEPDPRNPLEAARHPGLPVATVDLRLCSRAVQAGLGQPQTHTTRFAGDEVTWRQRDPAGAPCFPDSYEDVSPRTVDLRTPDWKQGWFQPRVVLLFEPPPTGFFPPDQVTLQWGERNDPAHEGHLLDQADGDLRRLSNPSVSSASPVTVTVTTRPVLKEAAVEIENLNFLDTLKVDGRMVLRGVAARKVVVTAEDSGEPVLYAVDCLFDEVEAPDGLVRLEFCTVRGSLTCRRLQASDCLFAGEVAVDRRARDAPGCVRFSRVPATLDKTILLHANTSDEPVFFAAEFCDSSGVWRRATAFGDPGYGTLHPATPDSICFGAEDGGEMGADHQRGLCLARAAVIKKLDDFLPLGIEAVLIPDPRLRVPPTTIYQPE